MAVAAVALALDAITKLVVVARLENRDPIELLGGLLTLRVTRNSGAAFSIGTGLTIVFTLIATGVVIAILVNARKLRSVPWAIALGLLLGGALGNLSDRMLRHPAPLKGHVVDWIELPNWPVFNLADSAIVVGGVLAVLLAARGLQLDGTRIPGDDAAETGEAREARTAEEPGEVTDPAGGPGRSDGAGSASPEQGPGPSTRPEEKA
ncbi:signal peptidase II [Actinomadura craniellae]|nr:signal peptidase II [Actinomadura craniellae]